MRSIISALALGAVALAGAAQDAKPSLVERLGFPKDAKVLIINADDFGMNHATNRATQRALASGAVTSATIMMPCAWSLGAIDFSKEYKPSVGVHTVLTSEWKHYKWGPVAGPGAVPSLVDKNGYFPPDVAPLYLQAKIEDVDKEIRAQIDKALKAGVDVTHIDSHMGAMQYAPGFHKLYIEIARDYNLPCRIAGRALMEQFGAGYLIDYADELGVLHCEELVQEQKNKETTPEATEAGWKEVMLNLEPGKVSEILIHCGEMTPEMEATTGSAARRTADTEFFAKPETLQWIKEQGIELISYRELRHLQREGAAMPRATYGFALK
jgi:predicted glycoside hydrolase/deacetylase ChbG (UPF0249 family)